MALATYIQLSNLLSALWVLSPKTRKAIEKITTGLPEATIGEAVKALECTKDEQDQLLGAAVKRDPTFPDRLSQFLRTTFASIKERAEREEQASVEQILPHI